MLNLKRFENAEPVRVLAVSGSLREGSLNRGLIRAAAELAPSGVRLVHFDLSTLPLYDSDLERGPLPEAALEWKAALHRADAVLIATPEYNYSTTSALKNAIEWGSRPPRSSPLMGKPVAIMGASPGRSGTARAQAHLRQMLSEPGARVLAEPRVEIAGAFAKFDSAPSLIDPESRKLVGALVEALGEMVISGGSQEAIPA